MTCLRSHAATFILSTVVIVFISRIPSNAWAQTDPVTWDAAPVIVDEDGISVFTPTNPAVAATDTMVHLAWVRDMGSTADLHYRRSQDDGATWLDNVVFTTGIAGVPSIAAGGGAVAVAWAEEVATGREVRVAVSTNAGMTWAATQTVSAVSAENLRCTGVVVSGSDVAVLWRTISADTATHYIGTSSDSGATWTTPAVIVEASLPTTYVGESRVGLSASTLVLAYNDASSVQATTSSDWGGVWTTPMSIASGAPPYGVRGVAADAAVAVAHVVDGPGDHLAVASTDGGLTWGAPANLTDGAPSDPTSGSVAAGGGLALCNWNDSTTMHTAYSLDFGVPWEVGATQTAFPAANTSDLSPSRAYVANWDGFRLSVLGGTYALLPTVTITAPTADEVLQPGTTSTPLTVAITNHPAPGYWAWQLDGPFPDTGAEVASEGV